MNKNQISFFATKKDLLKTLEDTRAKIPYNFSYLDENGSMKVYSSPDELENLSVMSVGDQNQSRIYLLIKPEEQPETRQVKQRKDKTKAFYDQISQPSSVSLRPGGILNGANCIIAGQVGTVTSVPWSTSLYKVISSSIKKKFTKIKSYYVGSEAVEKLNQGFRLTTNIKSPIEYDLNLK